MAVLQRVSLLPNQRLDTPDARSLEAFSLNDWRFFMKGFFSAKSEILQGFEIATYDTIFTVPGFALTVNDVVFFHSEATTQAAGFYVYAGTEPNQNISLAPSSTNFIEVDLGTSSDVPDVRAFWDAAANGGAGQEFTDTIDTVVNLDLSITSNITGFTSGRIPLYKVVTNSSNVVTSLTDCRSMFFRLGTGGNTPDPSHDFLWPSLPDSSHARFETPSTATSATATNAPFQGGDKNIKDWKSWMDAIMSSIKEIKGTQYWYQGGTGVPNLPSAYQNSSLIVLIGGTWEHLGTPTPIGNLALVGGSTAYRLGYNNNIIFTGFADIDMNIQPVLFVLLPTTDTAVTYNFGDDAATPIVPMDVTATSATSISVSLGGNYASGGGNILVHGTDFSYTSYTPGTGLFSGISPDPTSVASIGDLVYQTDSSGVGYYHYSSVPNVPGLDGTVSLGAERVMWLAVYDGLSVIMLHNGDIEQGEMIQVGDNTSLNILAYIGSPSEPTTTPNYATQATGSLNSTTNYNSVNGEDLTTRLAKLTSMMADKAQDRNIRVVRSGITNVVNTTSIIPITNQLITFTGATPALEVIIPGSANNMSVGLGGTLTLSANQAAYFSINRNSAISIADLSGLTVSSIDSVPVGENYFLFAARLSDHIVYLWDGSRINVGSWPANQILEQLVWDHLGVTSENTYAGLTSHHFLADADTYPTMFSILDNAMYGFATSFAQEERSVVGVGGITSYTASTISWSSDNTLKDISVYVNGRKLDQDETGGSSQDYHKTSATTLQFSFTLQQNAKLVIRNERTGAGGAWGVPVNSHIIPALDDTYDIGSSSFKFRDGYFAGKLTVDGGVDPSYVQLTPQPSDAFIPTNSLWIDGNDSNNLKFKPTGGSSSALGPVVTASNFFSKIMQNLGVIDIPASTPVSKLSDGSIVASNSGGFDMQRYVGITMTVIPALGGLGAVLLAGAGAENSITGLGFTPGDDVYINESGSYTNDASSLSTDTDSIFKVGIADCTAGAASSTANDIIMMPQVIVRPLTF